MFHPYTLFRDGLIVFYLFWCQLLPFLVFWWVDKWWCVQVDNHETPCPAARTTPFSCLLRSGSCLSYPNVVFKMDVRWWIQSQACACPIPKTIPVITAPDNVWSGTGWRSICHPSFLSTSVIHILVPASVYGFVGRLACPDQLHMSGKIPAATSKTLAGSISSYSEIRLVSFSIRDSWSSIYNSQILILCYNLIVSWLFLEKSIVIFPSTEWIRVVMIYLSLRKIGDENKS